MQRQADQERQSHTKHVAYMDSEGPSRDIFLNDDTNRIARVSWMTARQAEFQWKLCKHESTERGGKVSSPALQEFVGRLLKQ